MRREILWAVLCISILPSAALGQASFQPLGPQYRSMYAKGISADGRTAVGIVDLSWAFRWRAETGVVPILGAPGGPTPREAYAVSGDGSVIVGSAAQGTDPIAFRYTLQDGIVALGDLPGGLNWSLATGVSRDGHVIVGDAYAASGQEAFRKLPDQSMEGLGVLPGDNRSSARSVSADGSVIVGYSGAANRIQAARWTEAGGMQGLGIPDGAWGTTANAVSGDGSTIVGVISAANPESFRWTEHTGYVGLGYLPGTELSGYTYNAALAVSDDGSVIVGELKCESLGWTAFIWDSAHGIRILKDVLVNDYGLNLDGWRLTSATGISADGKTIVGAGTYLNNEYRAWIAHVPEPSMILMLLVAGGYLLKRRT